MKSMRNRQILSSSSNTHKARASVMGPGLFLLHPVCHLALILLVGCAAYANTFSVPFVLDDVTTVVGNPAVTSFALTFKSRVLGDLSFALDYLFHGTDVTGYHVVNLIVHLLNGCFVYGFVRLLLRSPLLQVKGEADSGRDLIPLFTALLFICHPVQTEAVTYISQRFASLATFFYLLTHLFWLLVKSAPSSGRRFLLGSAALLSAICAMGTKEIAFTIPVTLLLVELIFFPGSWRRLLPILSFVLASLLVPLALLVSNGWTGAISERLYRLVTPTTLVSRPDYLLTQLGVISTYLRLLFLPTGLNLDHDYPVYHSLRSLPVLAGLGLILMLLFAAGYLLRISTRSGKPELRLMAFGIFWFFITLSIESSVIPLQDLIFEHRLYLPSLGFFLLLITPTLAIFNFRKPVIVQFLAGVVLLLATGTALRNHVWRDEVSLWEDVVRKSPGKARGHGSLGLAYQKRGEVEAAELEYRKAIQLDPKDPAGYNNLGTLFFQQKKLAEAAKAYREVLRLDPKVVKAHYNLGMVLTEQGDPEGGAEELREATRLNPGYDQAHNNLGIAYAKMQRYPEALAEFRSAMELNPRNVDAVKNHQALEKALQGRGR